MDIKEKIMSGMFWKLGERIIAQGVSFIVSLILARILMPDDYGVVSIINIFISIADVFLSSGINTSLVQKQDADEVEFSTIFYCNLILGILLYFVLYLAAPLLATAYNMPILTSAIRVFALRLPISSFQAIQTAYVSKRMDFKKIFFSTVFGVAISAVVGVWMAVNGYGVWALIVQYLVNTVISTLVLFILVRWYPKMLFSWEKAKPLLKYGTKVMYTDLIGTLFNNLGDFIIGIRYSSSDLAFYSKGKQLPTLIRSNICLTLVSVLFPGLSQVNGEKEKVKELSQKSIRILSYMVYPMMVGLLAVATPVTILLYTEKWLPIVPFVMIVCIEGVLSIPGTIALQAVKATGRSDLMLKAEFVKKPVLLLSLIIAVRYGVYAIAWTLPFNTLIDVVVNGCLTKKTINYSLKELIADVSPAFLMSAVMGTIVYCIAQLSFKSTIVEVCICLATGVIVYVLLSLFSKNREFYILFNQLKRINKKDSVSK